MGTKLLLPCFSLTKTIKTGSERDTYIPNTEKNIPRKNKNIKIWEDSSISEVLSMKAWGPELIPQYCIKILRTVVHASNLRAGEEKRDGPLQFSGQLVLLILWVPGQLDTVSINKVDEPRGMTVEIGIWPHILAHTGV